MKLTVGVTVLQKTVESLQLIQNCVMCFFNLENPWHEPMKNKTGKKQLQIFHLNVIFIQQLMLDLFLLDMTVEEEAP